VGLFTRAVMTAADHPKVESLVTRGRLARPVVQRFVAGEDLEDAIQAIKDLNSRGVGGILDLLGEGVENPEGAIQARDDYLASVLRIEETGIDTTVTIKPSQLGVSFDKAGCIDHLRAIAAATRRIKVGIEIDMEQSRFVSDTIEVYRTLQPEFGDLRLAVQAYMRRTPADLQAMAELRPRVRLIKGAYEEPEAIALQKRSEITAQYAHLIEWLFDHGTDPGIATHDEALIEHARATGERAGATSGDYEIQMLYGIRRDLQTRLAREGFRVRVYVPFGSAWYPYLMRRIGERPANLRFFLRALAGR